MRNIVAWVQEDFGIELDKLEGAEHGADVAAAVWRGTAVDGRVYAVKWSGGGTAAGLLVPAQLATAGVRGVPAPVRARDGELATEREGRRLSVVPWISDEHSFDSEMTEARWRSYGAVLAATHAAEIEAEIPQETYDHERWTRAALEFPDRLAGELAAVWHTEKERIRAIVDQTNALGRELAAEPVRFVLCHADPHRGNVLLTGDQAWLIDWDDAMFSPRERDLMFALSGVEYFGPTTDQEREWFFQGYGEVELDERRLAYHHGVRALDDLVSWSEQALDETDPDRELALEIVQGLFDNKGLAATLPIRS